MLLSPIGRTRPSESCPHRCQKCDSIWFRKMSNTWGNLLSIYLLELSATCQTSEPNKTWELTFMRLIIYCEIWTQVEYWLLWLVLGTFLKVCIIWNIFWFAGKEWIVLWSTIPLFKTWHHRLFLNIVKVWVEWFLYNLVLAASYIFSFVSRQGRMPPLFW